MPSISRRDLLASGLAASAASWIDRSAWAQAAATLGTNATARRTETNPGIGPRERLLFDFGWRFKLGNGADPSKDMGFGLGQSDFSKTGDFRVAKAGFDDSSWRTLDLPHDWAVELPFEHDDSGNGDSQLRSHGYKPLGRRYPETSVGWYRREFEIPASDAGRRIWVEVDGAMRDSLIWVNGCFVGRNDSGYTPFRFDLTDFLRRTGIRTTSSYAWTQASAMAGFMKVLGFIATYGLARWMRSISADGRSVIRAHPHRGFGITGPIAPW